MPIFKKIIILTLCTFGLFSCKTENKPNIIFILTDDQRWDALGFAGNDIIHTPEMDQLASEGTYFKNAMVTTPICAASRATLLTGLHERTHNFDFSTGDVRNAYMAASYPLLLKENGYQTGFFGKLGIKSAIKDTLFHQSEYYDRANKPDRKSYFYKTLGADTVHLTRYTGQKALDFIDQSSSNEPFCLSLSFSAPHAADGAEDQYFWQEETDYLFQDLTIPDPLISHDSIFNKLPEKVKTGFNRLRWTWRYDTPEKYQHSVKGYYRMIAGIDLEIGKIRAKLKAKGIDKNTVIILMGDNGYFLGERQLAGKWLMYDNNLRVPLIINDPRTAKSSVVSDIALNVDVPATILSLAGIAKPTTWQGNSLLPYVNQDVDIKGRESTLVEHLWEFEHIPPSEGIRTKNLKYMRYINDKTLEELYDLDNDPMELYNLAANPSWTSAKSELKATLAKYTTAYTDDYAKGPYALKVSRNSQPMFTWQIQEKSISQKAYQILVATTAELLENNIGDLWNSGQVKSSKLKTLYEGLLLKKTEKYFWKVRIWDADNYTTNYSENMTLSIE
ncbi:MAG: alpha-L-rhamnosidase [Psychromonas sp.]|jgi:alpha-L-rhamnosidase